MPTGRASLTVRGRRGARRRAAGIQMIPVQDRVETEKEIALCLPAPIRTIRKQDDVSLAERRVDRDWMSRNGFAA